MMAMFMAVPPGLDQLVLVKQTLLQAQPYASVCGDVNISLMETNLTIEERRRPAVGGQVKRWRRERGMTLADVADRSGLNIGYLSQIENDKASPSLSCLASIGDALDVPIAWFLIDEVPPPQVVRASERPSTAIGNGRVERVDANASRGVSIVEAVAPPGSRTGAHAHAGDEHHVVLRGQWRMTQGDHVVEVGPGDYVRWDGTIPHDAEVIGEDEGAMLILRLRPER
jgi:transcriptional regulator with XRE-family HTH domain